MKVFSYEIKDAIGIHARPAGLLAKEAKKYESKITLSLNGKRAEATGVMGIMSLGAKHGQSIEVTVEGPDEEAAMTGMKIFFEENL